MAYKHISDYPPEQRETIREKQREAQRRYREKVEAFKAHFDELLRKEREAARNED